MLDKDKQVQKVSEGTLAVQASRDVNIGMQYSDVKDLVTLLLECNFPKLREEAVAEARLYVDKFSENLFEKISRLEVDVKNELRRPDVQAAINEGVEYTAKRTDHAELDTISDLIANKLLSEKGSLKSIVIDQSIEMLSKLDINLIRFFAFSYYLRRVEPSDRDDEEFTVSFVYGRLLESFFPLEDIRPVDSDYFQYLGAYSNGKCYLLTTSEKICEYLSFDIPAAEYQAPLMQECLMLEKFPYICQVMNKFGYNSVFEFDQLPLNKI